MLVIRQEKAVGISNALKEATDALVHAVRCKDGISAEVCAEILLLAGKVYDMSLAIEYGPKRNGAQ